MSPFALLQSLQLGQVRWTGGFWGERFDVCANVMVPTMGRLVQESQRVRFVGNFEVAAGLVEGKHRGARWNDGDFYKWLEAAAAVYGFTKDPALDADMDRLVTLIAKTQQEDGYIHTDVQIRQRSGEDVARFGNPMDFEMYNMGHLITAAIVHHHATGKSNLLAVARKAADFLARHFEHPTEQIARHGICPAHLMALVDLYRLTDHQPYLSLATKLLNMRDLVKDGDDDNQDRIPFRQQREAVGHAVRATYLYAGAADLYSETGDKSLMESMQSIWSDLVSHKLQITGGCGALFDGASPDGTPEQTTIRRIHQAFGRNYQLPQTTAHNETCAAIGNLFWNWRMFLITGEARFADQVEFTLFNSVLAGISLDGKSFFYTNTLRQVNPMPIDLRWNRRRLEFTGCFCCPPNVVRTIAQSSTYAYAESARGIFVVLYGSNSLETDLADAGQLRLRQETNYPSDGKIRITIEAAPSTAFSIHLRIPDWARDASIRVNQQLVAKNPTRRAFYEIHRTWSAGDAIELDLPMTSRLIESNPYVEELRHQVAVVRGPIVYCIESVDLPPENRILDVHLPVDAAFTETSDDRLPGLNILETRGFATAKSDHHSELYREVSAEPSRPINLRLIPYFAWDNRGESEMTVWVGLTRSNQS
jgi:DUF1680 family protein